MGDDIALAENNSVYSFRSFSSKEYPIGKVQFDGASNEFIVIGNKKYYTHELMRAFGGTLNPGPAPFLEPKFGNPASLGLSAFAMTTFVLSLVNAQAMGITVPNIVVGLACFYGGTVQFSTGVWELFLGNTFGGTALTLYGAFWLSFAAIRLKAFGIIDAYGTDADQLSNAVGFYLIGWAIFTFLLTLVTMKSTLAFFLLFFSLTITFILLAGGEFSGKVGVTRAGGIIGVITAFIAWYNAWAGVATKQNSYFTSHVIPLPHSS